MTFCLLLFCAKGPVKGDVEMPFEEVLDKAKAGDPKAQTEVRTACGWEAQASAPPRGGPARGGCPVNREQGSRLTTHCVQGPLSSMVSASSASRHSPGDPVFSPVSGSRLILGPSSSGTPSPPPACPQHLHPPLMSSVEGAPYPPRGLLRGSHRPNLVQV